MSKKRNIKASRKIVKLDSLKQLNLNAAGLDIGDEEIWAAIPEGRQETSVRQFPTFTSDLHALANWLEAAQVNTVAMESTGVYWIPAFEILEERGFEVLIVNARHIKNVPGKKSDVLDCQWIQQLHTYGLLRGSFVPTAEIRSLRSYIRHRDSFIRHRSAHIQHIQKYLQLMNIKLTNVLSDITGLTGMLIIKAILNGERNPQVLARFRHGKCAKSEEVIAKSLHGNFKPEHLFALRQMVEMFEFYNHQIAICDTQIETLFSVFKPQVDLVVQPLPKPKYAGRRTRNEPAFDLRTALYKSVGVDLTAIDGIHVLTAQTVISEIGLDMSRWRTVKHFTSWLGLCPHNDISGGKVQKRYSKKSTNRAAQALRNAARALSRSQSSLGAYYRRMRSRKGVMQANVAAAHKLARIIYFMLKYKKPYHDPGIHAYEAKQSALRIKYLQRQAARLGMKILPISSD
ncbi:MAG: IS110 family transposase [Chloroflexi bacterium]|nr:IS110 family transposase [Chloroflexota bacterium]